jgi:hypothetical protein
VELLIQQYDVGDDVGLLLKCPVASVLMKAWLEGYLLRDEERSGCALAYYYVKPDGMPRDEAIERAMRTSAKLRRDRKERNVDHNLKDTMDGRKGIDRRRLSGNKRQAAEVATRFVRQIIANDDADEDNFPGLLQGSLQAPFQNHQGFEGGDDDGTNDDGTNDDGTNDDGTNDDGTNDDGTNDDGTNDDGTNDDGTNDDGEDDGLDAGEDDGLDAGEDDGLDADGIPLYRRTTEQPPQSRRRGSSNVTGCSERGVDVRSMYFAEIRRLLTLLNEARMRLQAAEQTPRGVFVCGSCDTPTTSGMALGGCNHVMCVACFEKQATTSNQCPYCRSRCSRVLTGVCVDLSRHGNASS